MILSIINIDSMSKIIKNDIKINAIFLVDEYSDLIADKIKKFQNISYTFLKEAKLMAIEKYILSFQKENTIKQNNIHLVFTKMLHDLGVPSNLIGYFFIREGSIMLYNDPMLIKGLTKEIYPKVADMFNTTSSTVERSIRYDI